MISPIEKDPECFDGNGVHTGHILIQSVNCVEYSHFCRRLGNKLVRNRHHKLSVFVHSEIAISSKQ